MDDGSRGGWDGGPGGGARREDDALGSGWEAVPPLSFLFHLSLGGDDGTESFGCVQPSCNVCKDVREAHVVLWGRCGQLWQVHVYPSLEPDVCSLVCTKGEWRRDNSGGFYCDVLKEGQDVVAIDCEGGQRLGCGRLGSQASFTQRRASRRRPLIFPPSWLQGILVLPPLQRYRCR